MCVPRVEKLVRLLIACCSVFTRACVVGHRAAAAAIVTARADDWLQPTQQLSGVEKCMQQLSALGKHMMQSTLTYWPRAGKPAVRSHPCSQGARLHGRPSAQQDRASVMQGHTLVLTDLDSRDDHACVMHAWLQPALACQSYAASVDRLRIMAPMPHCRSDWHICLVNAAV